MEYRNTKKQGDAGLGAAIAHFTQQGCCVNIPLTDSQEYDLIIDYERKLLRVQVKTTSSVSSHGIYQVELRTTGGNKSRHNRKMFDNKEIDLVFVLAGDGNKYIIPADFIESVGQINLGRKYLPFRVTPVSLT